MRFHLQTREIGPFSVDKNLLPMLEVFVFQIGFGADSEEILVVIMNPTVNTMTVFHACYQIVFNAFRTCGYGTVFAGDTLSNHRGIGVGTDGTMSIHFLRCNDFIFHFSSHGIQW
jgi:hypothetical protein